MRGRRPWVGGSNCVCVCVCVPVKAEGNVLVVEIETIDGFNRYLGGKLDRAWIGRDIEGEEGLKW